MSFARARLLSYSLLPLLAACGDKAGDDSIYGNDEMSSLTINDDDIDTTPGDSSSSAADTESSSSDDASEGIKLDVLGQDETMGTAGDAGDGNGCKKVDFLFIVDNSGSMLEEQDNLAASFPAFINSIQSTLADAQDYHIMVLDTDAWVFAGCQLLKCAGFPPLPGICVGFECGDQPAQCEDVLGAGVTFPKGANASNLDCNFSTGLRFMDSTQPNLAGAFQCAARVGTDSTDDPERGMEAMVNAVSGVNPYATCNGGFLRDDAILVVTFVTDEDDNPGDGSAGSVDTWRQALIDAKNGDEQAIVVLGLFGGETDPNLGDCGAEASPRLQQFLDSWGDKGIYGSICSEDYDVVFQQAVDTIDTTCDEFEPPG